MLSTSLDWACATKEDNPDSSGLSKGKAGAPTSLAWKRYSGPEEIPKLEVKAKPCINGVRGIGGDAGSLIMKENPLTIKATNDDSTTSGARCTTTPAALCLKDDTQSLDSWYVYTQFQHNKI